MAYAPAMSDASASADTVTPAPLPGGALGGGHHLLHVERVLEAGLRRRVVPDGAQQPVLALDMRASEPGRLRPVRDLLAGVVLDGLQPPVAAHAAERLGRIGRVVDLQPTRLLGAEADRAAVAEHFHLQVVHGAGAHAAHLDQPEHAAGRAQVQEAAVVHLHRRQLVTAGADRAAVDQRLQGGVDRLAPAEQVADQIQHVAAQVVHGPAAGGLLVQPPGHRLGGVDVAGAVVPAAKGEDAPQEALVDELLRAGDGGKKPEVEGRLRLHARAAHRVGHAGALGDRAGQRLLAVDVLAGRRGRHHHRLVQIVGHRAVDEVDVVPVDDAPVVFTPRWAADLPRRPLGGGRGRGRHGGDPHRVRRQAVVVGDRPIGQRVHRADAAVADQPHPDRGDVSHGHVSPRGRRHPGAGPPPRPAPRAASPPPPGSPRYRAAASRQAP